MRENTTTDPTMLSAKNFPREEEGVLRKRFSHASGFLLFKQLTKGVNVQFINEIPQPFNHILDLLHALPLLKNDQTVPN